MGKAASTVSSLLCCPCRCLFCGVLSCLFSVATCVVFTAGLVALILYLLFRPHIIRATAVSADLSAFTLTPRTWILLYNLSLAVQLHKPLTGQRASLPRATSLLFPTSASKAYRITDDFRVRSAGLAGGSSVALHYGNSAVAVARPGDKCWTQLGPVENLKSAASFAGRFYCVTFESISVLEATASQPPRLVAAVDLKPHCGRRFSWSDMAHLVDRDGELVLVHCVLCPTSTNFCGRYTAYRVNLDKRDMVAIPGLR